MCLVERTQDLVCLSNLICMFLCAAGAPSNESLRAKRLRRFARRLSLLANRAAVSSQEYVLALSNQRRQIGQLFHKETVEAREQAIGQCLIVEVVPRLELVDLDVEAGHDGCPRLDGALDVMQEGAEHGQQHEPEQPRLADADKAAEQRIAQADEGDGSYHAAYHGADDMQDQHSAYKDDDIGDERRRREAAGGQQCRKFCSIEVGYRECYGNAYEIYQTEDGSIAYTIKEEQDDRQ